MATCEIMAEKNVYEFEEGNLKMKNLLGGKGANLSEMTNLGLPIPNGFIVTTNACKDFNITKPELPKGLESEIFENIKRLELKNKTFFGNIENPLLVSVRSGAPVSMPGMMDTILNLGLNDETIKGLIKKTKNERFALDCYRRFIQMFGDVVLKIDHKFFEKVLSDIKMKKNVELDTELDAKDLKKVVSEYKKIIKKKTKKGFPQDPNKQLIMSIKAVFDSWNNPRAITYRKLNDIPDDFGTAVNVQTMVFGNMGEDSGSGVVFTRDPGNGDKRMYGEFLINAQGEDVVAGIRTPLEIKKLYEKMPKMYKALKNALKTLEYRYKDMQDVEFTIERNKLYILQTRTGKRTAHAAVKIAVEMVNDNLIDEMEAILRIKPENIEKILHKTIDPKAKIEIITKGLNASPGAATGKVVLDIEEAYKLGEEGEKIILVREETTADDIHGMAVSEGVLTCKGGATSHAAVVARGMGKPCVSGCEDLRIDTENNLFKIGDLVVKAGDYITINGSSGEVILGKAPLIDSKITKEMNKILEWSDKYRKLRVKANANTTDDAKIAKSFGAEGIGLCRTERMFNAADRLPIMQSMILADSKKERIDALNKLKPMQKEDFKGILRIMEGLPVTIRLLDIPLHEFLPPINEVVEEIETLKNFKRMVDDIKILPEKIKFSDPQIHEYLPVLDELMEEIRRISEKGIEDEIIRKKQMELRKIMQLTEVNPMLGHRGVRLGLTFPEIYEMQIRAIYEASVELIKEGVKIAPEIMVPQVCTSEELKWVHKIVKKTGKEIKEKEGVDVKIKFGTMIEVVRACIRAGRLADVAEFFSFGTNDLSQATFSFSREDAENKFLPLYTQRKILQDDPFKVLDVKGVGRLMDITIEWGRKSRRNLEIGVCGEHGGEPTSIKICHDIDVDYVSCSPFRIPIARLAAAHAALTKKEYNL